MFLKYLLIVMNLSF